MPIIIEKESRECSNNPTELDSRISNVRFTNETKRKEGNMKEIIIEEQKSLLMKRVRVAALMVVASVAVLVLGFVDTVLIMKLLGIAATLYFLLCLVVLAKRALNRKPLLVITEESIQDSSSALSLGEVLFSEIEHFEIVNVYGQRTIGIVPVDTEQFMERLTKSQKQNAKLCLDRGYPPVSLRVDTAKDMTIEDIFALLQKRLEAYKSNL